MNNNKNLNTTSSKISC